MAALIEKILNPKTEEKGLLISKPSDAVLCHIVTRMNDRRSLPDPAIALRNKSPDAFEEKRFYGPKKVVDALAAILNQITGRSCGFIYNAATEGERTNTVREWRDFLNRTPASKLCLW